MLIAPVLTKHISGVVPRSPVEEATRATQYAASITPFQKTKDGRGAFNALTKQYAGKDKHEAVIKHNEKVLHTAESDNKRTGTTINRATEVDQDIGTGSGW